MLIQKLKYVTSRQQLLKNSGYSVSGLDRRKCTNPQQKFTTNSLKKHFCDSFSKVKTVKFSCNMPHRLLQICRGHFLDAFKSKCLIHLHINIDFI